MEAAGGILAAAMAASNITGDAKLQLHHFRAILLVGAPSVFGTPFCGLAAVRPRRHYKPGLILVKGELRMFCSVFCSAAILMVCSGSLQAADKPRRGAQANQVWKAVFVKVDIPKNTVTIKTTDKEGKVLEKTVTLAKGAKVLGQNDEPVTIAEFAKYMANHTDKSILVLQGKGDGDILEIMDLPSKKSQEPQTNRVIRAVFVNVDVSKNTVTFKTTAKDGMTQEETAALAKGARVLGENDEPVTIAGFAKYMANHTDKSILVLEGEKDCHIHEIMDLRGKQ
jgi:arginine repressor